MSLRRNLCCFVEIVVRLLLCEIVPENPYKHVLFMTMEFSKFIFVGPEHFLHSRQNPMHMLSLSQFSSESAQAWWHPISVINFVGLGEFMSNNWITGELLLLDLPCARTWQFSLEFLRAWWRNIMWQPMYRTIQQWTFAQATWQKGTEHSNGEFPCT